MKKTIVLISLLLFSFAASAAEHPYLIWKKGEEEALKRNVASDIRWTRMHEAVLKESDAIIDSKDPAFKCGERKTMHTQCCEAVRRALFLSYSYRMTGDKRYLDRAAVLAEKMCALDSWNPYHFLDIAELTVAASFIYDWCYDGLSNDLKKKLEKSIHDKALVTSETGGEGNAAYNLRWMDMTSNWSQICHGSLAIGALAIYDKDKELAQRIFDRTHEKIQIPMRAEYPPMGAYSQGIGYWGYGTCLNAIYLDAMQNYFGEDSVADLKAIPGFMSTATYFSQLITNSGKAFSFADNSTGEILPEHCTFWFYKETHDPVILHHQKPLFDKYYADKKLVSGSYGRHLPLMIIWGAGTGDKICADFSEEKAPEGLFYLADGMNPICTMRSGWGKKDWWVGFKAGNPSCAHGHMDVGEFLFEWNGASFSTDLGSDGYGKINALKLGSMFKMDDGAMRWTELLRYNNFSHSTITVGGDYQNLETKSEFISFNSDPDNMSAAADLTPTYKGQLQNFTRTVTLEKKSRLVVEDEIEAKSSSNAQIVWNMTTMADGFEFDQATNTIFLTAKNDEGEKCRMKLSILFADPSAGSISVKHTPVNDEFKYPSNEKSADGCYFLRIKYTVKKGCTQKMKCIFTPQPSDDQMIQAAFDNAKERYIDLAGSVLASNPGKFPHSFKKDGTLTLVTSGGWTSGFFPGTLWYIYEYTKDDKIKEYADKYTDIMEAQRHNANTHDIGFMMYCSYGNSFRLLPTEEKKQILLDASNALCTRFNPTVGCIRSWDKEVRPGWHYPVIIDNMMNLEMLLWAWKETSDEKYLNVARTHALTTMKNHFRKDASSYHVVNYDPKTGKPVFRGTFQGLADDSSWARGQGWGLYGNTVLYRYTGEKVFLDHAKKIAKYIMTYPDMPEDKIPLWDFKAPKDAPRDASAAALYASALLELSGYVDGKLVREYQNYAKAILRSLSRADYTAAPGENGGFLLKHSVTAFPLDKEIDQPLNYADYYYLEALLRLKDIK